MGSQEWCLRLNYLPGPHQCPTILPCALLEVGAFRAILETNDLFAGWVGKPSSSWTPPCYLGILNLLLCTRVLFWLRLKTGTSCLTSIPFWSIFFSSFWGQNWGVDLRTSISSVAHPPSNVLFLEQPASGTTVTGRRDSRCAKEEALLSSTDIKGGDGMA